MSQNDGFTAVSPAATVNYSTGFLTSSKIIHERSDSGLVTPRDKMDARSARPSGPDQAITRLMDLPPELIHQILEYLVPDFPEIGDTRPVAYDKLVPAETWYDITRNRRALRQVCLTSRSLCTIAQPLLYRVISILDEEGMVLLFRTLTERPAIGASVRSLSCHMTLTRLEVIREMKRVLLRLVKTFRPDDTMLRQIYPGIHSALRIMFGALPFINTSSGDFDDVPQIMLFYILTFLNRLETFMLQVPICDDHPEYTAILDKMSSTKVPWMGVVHEEASRAQAVYISPTGEPPLQHVKTLLLQGDPELLMHFESDSCDCEVPELWGSQARRYYPLYNALPSLTTLEVSCDDGVWENVRKRRPDGSRPLYLERIKHLYLHNSIAFPRDLHHVLLNAPNLQTLYMTPRRDPEPLIDPDIEGMDEHPESLDAALVRGAKHLRHLDLAWYDCAGNEPLLGPEGRLPSLPRLAHLEKLCVQLSVLYGSDAAALLTPMADLLPPNLVELTLEEWWWEQVDTFDEMFGWSPAERVAHYQTRGDYRSQAIAMLMGLAADCAGEGDGEGNGKGKGLAVAVAKRKMPRLRKVTFQTKFLWTWRMDGYIDAARHFEGVRRAFQAAGGIEFAIHEDQTVECFAEAFAS